MLYFTLVRKHLLNKPLIYFIYLLRLLRRSYHTVRCQREGTRSYHSKEREASGRTNTSSTLRQVYQKSPPEAMQVTLALKHAEEKLKMQSFGLE